MGSTGTRYMFVRVFGDTADEIELAALDEARAFFGSGVVLTVCRNYSVSKTENYSNPRIKNSGKTYTAEIKIETSAYQI